MKFIESIHNPKVLLWNQLKTKKGRDQQGLYLIEGIKIIEEALLFKVEIEVIIVNDGFTIPSTITDLLLQKKIDIITVSDVVFRKLVDTETPQGILAIVKKIEYMVDQIFKKDNNFLLLIDEIQDPGNLGAIIRSADAAGVSGIIIGKDTVDLYNPKVIRSAMGSIYHLPIIINNFLDETICELKEIGIKIIGTSPYAETDYYNINLIKDIALLVGNESKGLSKNRKREADLMIKIPILGAAESLNVAMATTIILFEHVRQKTGNR